MKCIAPSRPSTRTRRKKMASIGVEAMRNMITMSMIDDSTMTATATVTSPISAATAVVVSIPASPPSKLEREREREREQGHLHRIRLYYGLCP
mmetsp:Transcript_19279/g.21268  ORF Transcript_19279/g.21268 Transcript_19279/m.21268 type:complete len:93 (+) Transcript_19279:385-663(+)